MKLKELLAMDSFEKCQLLTKREGVKNNVKSAMILETISTQNEFHKEQLVITTISVLQKASKKEIRLLLQEMKKQAISAFIVKLDQKTTNITDYLVRQCDYFSITLIQAPENVSYEKFLLAIYQPLLKNQERLLRTYYEVRQEFTKVERNLRSFEQIMEVFYRLIQLPCMLQLPDLEIDLRYGESFAEYSVENREFLETSEFSKNKYEQLHLIFSGNGQTKRKTAIETQIISPIVSNGKLRIYQKDNDKTLQSDLMILENVIDLIHEQIQLVHLLKKQRYIRMNNLADAILQTPPENSDELENLLDEADINSYPYFQGVAFDCDSEISSQKIKNVTKKLRELRPSSIYFDHHKCTVVLFNLKNKEDLITKKELTQVFFKAEQGYEQFQFVASQIKQKNNLKGLLFDCLDGLRFNKTFSLDPVVSFNDLGVFQIYMRDSGPKQMMEAIPENLTQLWTEDNDLFVTLYTFFINNRNFKKTAEALFMHPKTVRYRLSKISKSLELDLSDAIQLVNYEMGSYFLHMRKYTKIL
ncbi:helix-turn-helix domain-containing protein [Tetragenococcus halophilus]|uniref:helix-turn-helix domain-containing protein n=1 Tax=Tetragenococcus halophilus TaxID=51669 RepID=UPI001F48896B|nr:PucR family transcriptional regulator [Tetragenococcus halophilus]MCF1684115.1 helix-turn-helix domain-containing protein [Tetragenococcus halophilus]